MDKEEVKRKKLQIETIKKYNFLIKDISETFIPIPTIFQFFVLDKKEMKSFLSEYYKIYLSLKSVFYSMYEVDDNFNSDDKTIFYYIKNNNYTEEIIEFKDSNIFNLSKLKGIRDFLIDKIILFEDNKFKYEVNSELKKISNKISKLERKKTSIIKLSDSSLTDKEFNEFNILLNKNNFHLWDAFEKLEINLSSEYLKYSSNKEEAEFIVKKTRDIISSKYNSFLGDNNSNDLFIKKQIKKIDSKITKTEDKNQILELKKEKDKLKFELYSEKIFLPDRLKLEKLRSWKKIQNINIDISNNTNNTSINESYDLKNYDLSFIGIDLLYIESESDFTSVINNIFDGFYEKNYYENDYFFSNDEKISHIFSGINYLSNTIFSKYINMFYYEHILDYKILGESYITKYRTNKYFDSVYDLRFFIPIVNDDTISLYYIFFDPFFFAGYDDYNVDLVTNLTKKITLLNKEIKKVISNDFFDTKSSLLNENLVPTNTFNLVQKDINNTIKDLHEYIKSNLNKTCEGIIYSSFIKCYSNGNENFFCNNNYIFQSDLLSNVLNTKTFCYFFSSSLYFDSNLNPNEKIYLERLFKNLFEYTEEVSSIDSFLENYLSQEDLNNYRNDELSITVFLYPIKTSDLSIIGIYLAIFKRESADGIQSEYFIPIKNTINEIFSRIEFIINLDIIYDVKSNLIDSIDEIDELKLLNNIFFHTRNTNYFPSIFFISDMYNLENYNKLYQLIKNNKSILDLSDFNHLQIEKVFKSVDITFNKNDIKSLKLFLLKDFEYEKNLNQQIIIIFAYKSYNSFFFDSNYSDEIINIIKKEILSQFYMRRKNIELKNLHEMIFAMLEHKIGTDVLVNNEELEIVSNNINALSEFIEDEKYNEIKSSLEFVIYTNKERQKFLKSVKPLLFNNIDFSNISIFNINIKKYLKEEIKNIIKLKIASNSGINLSDWKNLKTKVKCYIENIDLFDVSIEFIGFIFFELLSNAVKYKDNFTDNTVDFDIGIEDKFLKISVSNVLKDIETLNIKEIFDKGKRFGDSKKTSGTGLGLYIIRYITENTFNGRVFAEIVNQRIFISVKLLLDKLG